MCLEVTVLLPVVIVAAFVVVGGDAEVGARVPWVKDVSVVDITAFMLIKVSSVLVDLSAMEVVVFLTAFVDIEIFAIEVVIEGTKLWALRSFGALK